MSGAKITKLDVARDHIETAVLLNALGADDKSVHLVVMAADELIRAYAKATGKTLSLDIDAMIRDDAKKVWFAAKSKAYNYFKHADRDAEVEYDGPEGDKLTTLNDLTILMAVTNLRALGVGLSAAASQQANGFLVLNPQMAKWDEIFADHPELKDGFDSLGEVTRKDLMLASLATKLAEGAVSQKDVEAAIAAQRFVKI